jgi:hypothetical protein
MLCYREREFTLNIFCHNLFLNSQLCNAECTLVILQNVVDACVKDHVIHHVCNILVVMFVIIDITANLTLLIILDDTTIF